MAKLFAVLVQTVPNYYDYKKEHPEHDRDQLEWFRQQHEQGNLLCCGPFYPHDGTGMWIIQAEDLDKAMEVVNSSPRARDKMLAESSRVVEWKAHIGVERFT